MSQDARQIRTEQLNKAVESFNQEVKRGYEIADKAKQSTDESRNASTTPKTKP